MKTMIGLYPWSKHFMNNKVFTIESIYNLSPDRKIYGNLNFMNLLKENLNKSYIDIVTIDLVPKLNELKYIIFFNIPKYNDIYFKRCRREKLNSKMVLFLWEPLVVSKLNFDINMHKYFDVIFTWDDDLVDNKKYFKFNFPQPREITNPYLKNFQEKYFCTLIAGNKKSSVRDELYSERVKIIKFFEKNYINGFDLYGRGWNPSQNFIKNILLYSKKENSIFESYKGETANKLKTLSQYKFCICYENQKNIKGYITEKIFDCFFAGTIPIYWGAENISKYIPGNCYIDRRDFNDNHEILDYLLDFDEKKYSDYIMNIENYLKSEDFLQFTDKCFVDNIINLLTKNNRRDTFGGI